MRQCTSCENLKGPTEFYPKAKSRPNDLNPRCIECTKKSIVEWRRRNPEKMRAKRQRYREKHRESLRRKGLIYWAKNRERLHASHKASRVRRRFAILSRDNFTCRYCGRKPPEVV